MKVTIGNPGSVSKDDIEEIEKERMNIRFEECPLCLGTGRSEVPDSDASTAAKSWWKRLKQALELKPPGVELLLASNSIIVIDDPGDTSVIDSGDVQLHFGESGVIKYITSEVKYEFDDDVDEDVDKISREELRKEAIASFKKAFPEK